MNPPCRFVLSAACIVAGGLLCSCGGGSTTPPPPPTQNPAPAIQSISPTSAAAGTGGFTLTITGSGFLSSSTVSWNGAARQAALGGSSQLTIAVASADLNASGTASITVTNPAPGGGQTSTDFTISPPAAPLLTSVSPNTFGSGSGPIPLTLTGTNFVMSSMVLWNGSNLATTYISNTQLMVSVPASNLTSPVASLPITVSTPSPGGGTSNSVSVAVVNTGLPTISSLNPSQAVLGGPAFTLTVNGTNFVGGAEVNWNSIARVTQFVSTTQLTASILASDIALPSPNSASITVENPVPSPGISSPVSLILENPVPQITSVSPNTAIAGPPISVAISGTGFVSGATVQLGNLSFPTTFASSTSLSVQISASVGLADLRVTNPAPSAGPSNAAIFTGSAAGPGIQLFVPTDSSGIVVEALALSSTGEYVPYVAQTSDGYILDTCLGGPSGCSQMSTLFVHIGGNLFSPVATANTTGISTTGRYVTYASYYQASRLRHPPVANLNFWPRNV